MKSILCQRVAPGFRLPLATLLPLLATALLSSAACERAEPPATGQEAPVEQPGQPSPEVAAAMRDDARAISEYRLTMDKVRAWNAANVAIARAATRNPELAELVEQEDDAPDAQSIRGVVRRIQSSPLAVQSIRSAGLEPREYALIGFALVQAMFAHGAMQSGQLTQLPAEVNRQNVEFVRENEAEIRRLAEEPPGSSPDLQVGEE